MKYYLHLLLFNYFQQVCAPSCHDCSPLRAWWEEDKERRIRYFKTIVGCDDTPPPNCTPQVAYFVIQQHFESPSMWAIFPLQVSTFSQTTLLFRNFAKNVCLPIFLEMEGWLKEKTF